VPAGGGDPTGTCSPEGASTCGRNGTCDGAGGCARYDSNTVCASACSSGTDIVYTYCDGMGICGPNMASATCPMMCVAGSPDVCQ
jgi:hypothetical protein